MVKSCVQVTLIAFAKTLGRVQPFTHGIVFIIVMVVYTLSCLRVPSFNYPRVRMWHCISLIAVCWLSMLTVCDLYTDEHTAYVVLLIVGWCFLGFAGLYLMWKKFPGLLYRQKNEAYGDILSFAFRPKGDWSLVESKRNSSYHSAMNSNDGSKKVVPADDKSAVTENLTAMGGKTDNDRHSYVNVNNQERL